MISFKNRLKASPWLIWLGLGLITTLFVVLIPRLPTLLQWIFHPLETGILQAEYHYQQWFDQRQGNHPGMLIPLAFMGGLIASLSPCILGLLPLNLSYIGTLNVTSKRDAVTKASWFVFGAITVLSGAGLFAAWAAAIFVDFRGYVNLGVGTIVLFMAASLVGLVRIPLPTRSIELPIPGTYGVGVTFALVSSPCASPVLFSVLTAAAASGSPVWSVLAMVSYAIGYTAVIFCASLFTGLVKQSRVLLHHADRVMGIGSLVLFMTGLYYVVTGILWFLS